MGIMGMTGTTILGGHQSDFARNLRREGATTADLVRETILHAIDDARIDLGDIESIHVGNAFGQLYTGQGHMGAMPATVVPELWGVPSMRHEAACASSSMATLSAMAEIEAGRYDCVLVLGVEQEKTMPGPEAAAVQEAAAWVGEETDRCHLHLARNLRPDRRRIRRPLRYRRCTLAGDR